jgi:hypothetical protein
MATNGDEGKFDLSGTQPIYSKAKGTFDSDAAGPETAT